MFGHNDEKNDETSAHEPQHDAVLEDSSTDSQVTTSDDSSVQSTDHHDSPAFSPDVTTAPAISVPATSDDTAADTSDDEPAVSHDLVDSSADSDLIDIKQSALKQLSPLVGHLDQTPEEKFRTTMMLIQASDNHSLIKDAYTAAQSISDEKTKAQALLDIVNEINYFTQQTA